MRTVLIIFGIWLLLNVLFVVLMEPPRKPRKQNVARSLDGGYAPVTIRKEAYPFNEEEKTSLSFIIVSVAMGAFFVLALPIAKAADAIGRAFRKRPPAE
jgi:hypothetical protein